MHSDVKKWAETWLLQQSQNNGRVSDAFEKLPRRLQSIVAAYLRLGDAEAPDAPWIDSFHIVPGRESDHRAGLVPLKPPVKSERKNQERELKEAQETYRKDARDERLVDNLRRVFG